jgi:phosphoribosylglycinamide formyltransferase-1
MDSHPVNIAIFASGSGTNAQRIMEYFRHRDDIRVKILLSNNPKAYALERASTFDVPVKVFNREEFFSSDSILNLLKEKKIDWLILAGFLWLIPTSLTKAFDGKILNIHPALLPSYGGKGMYGMKVHEAVIAAKERESGISIHFVNENYDEGEVVFQAKCLIEPDDTPEILAEKIHQLEYMHFPEVIEKFIKAENSKKINESKKN